MTTPPPDRTPAAGPVPPTAEPPRTRRNALVGLSTLSAVVLALSYHTSLDAQSAGATRTASAQQVPGASSAGAAAAPGVGAAAGAASSAGAGAATTGPAGNGQAAAAAAGGLTDGTYTGASASTQWGPVQVRIVVSGGRISTAEAVTYPSENPRDQMINSQAVPAYESATVAAQSASIDAISGATVTWQGYTSSLQSAIDQARA